LEAAKKKYMRERYNATATGYDELYREEQYEKYGATISYLAGVDRICDIGCGTLLLLEYLEGKGLAPAYYVGVDLSPGMLRVASSKLRDSRLRGVAHLVDLVEADAEHLPLRAGSCTMAVSYTVIDLVERPEAMLAEMRRVAGRALVTSLKKAHRLRGRVVRPGRYFGETSKDYIFLID